MCHYSKTCRKEIIKPGPLQDFSFDFVALLLQVQLVISVRSFDQNDYRSPEAYNKCAVLLIFLLSNEMQMSVRRFSAIPHLRASHVASETVQITRRQSINKFSKLSVALVN